MGYSLRQFLGGLEFFVRPSGWGTYSSLAIMALVAVCMHLMLLARREPLPRPLSQKEGSRYLQDGCKRDGITGAAVFNR